MGRLSRVAVSALARYAADPVDTINPKPKNKAALAYGTKAHGRLGRQRSSKWLIWLWVVLVASAALAVLLRQMGVI